MNKIKAFGYLVGFISIAWSIYLISTGRIVLAIAFFGLGCIALEVSDNLSMGTIAFFVGLAGIAWGVVLVIDNNIPVAVLFLFLSIGILDRLMVKR